MNANSKKELVRVFLEFAHHEPVNTKTICALCNISSRDLQNAVRDLRLEGMKICSGDKGYWLWDGKDDSWSHTKAQLKSRIGKLYQLLSAMEGNIEGQQEWHF